MQNGSNLASLLSVNPPVARDFSRVNERTSARDNDNAEHPSFEQTLRDVRPTVSASSAAAKRRATEPAGAEPRPTSASKPVSDPSATSQANPTSSPDATSSRSDLAGQSAESASDAAQTNTLESIDDVLASVEYRDNLPNAAVEDDFIETVMPIELGGVTLAEAQHDTALMPDVLAMTAMAALAASPDVDGATDATRDDAVTDLLEEVDALINPLLAEQASIVSEELVAGDVRYLATAMSSVMGRMPTGGALGGQPATLASVPAPSFAEGLLVMDDGLSATAEDNPFELASPKSEPSSTTTSSSTADRATSFAEAYKSLSATGSPLDASMKPTVPVALAPTDRTFIVQTAMQVPLGQPQWSQAVGEKVLWFAAQNISSAEIRLDPPELGPMQVRVHVHQDQVNVTFTSQNPQVRDALDQQLNRLREMFAEQGLNLGDVNVSGRSRDEAEQQHAGQNPEQHEAGDDSLAPLGETAITSHRLVDHYA